MAKKLVREGKKYSYMDTYGDLVTLLLCFFVLLFAMSSVESTKYNAFVEALTTRFGAEPVNLSTVPEDMRNNGDDFGIESAETNVVSASAFDQMNKAIQQFITENNLQGSVTAELGQDDIAFIRLTDHLLFDGDSSDLSERSLEFLNFLGSYLNDISDMIFQIRFMGHTASIPGSQTDDWILSCERSGRVASYFESNNVAFPSHLMQSIGYGRHYPIGDNSAEAGIAKNRRVDIVIIGSNPETLMFSLAAASRVYFPSDDTRYFEGSPDKLPEAMLDKVMPLDNVARDKSVPEGMDSLADSVDHYYERVKND